MTKRIKGYSLHHDDGTSETHVIKGNIPRASFFQHEGDFKDTVPTEPGELDAPRSYKPAGMQHDNPYIARLLAIAVVSISVITVAIIIKT